MGREFTTRHHCKLDAKTFWNLRNQTAFDEHIATYDKQNFALTTCTITKDQHGNKWLQREARLTFHENPVPRALRGMLKDPEFAIRVPASWWLDHWDEEHAMSVETILPVFPERVHISAKQWAEPAADGGCYLCSRVRLAVTRFPGLVGMIERKVEEQMRIAYEALPARALEYVKLHPQPETAPEVETPPLADERPASSKQQSLLASAANGDAQHLAPVVPPSTARAEMPSVSQPSGGSDAIGGAVECASEDALRGVPEDAARVGGASKTSDDGSRGAAPQLPDQSTGRAAPLACDAPSTVDAPHNGRLADLRRRAAKLKASLEEAESRMAAQQAMEAHMATAKVVRIEAELRVEREERRRLEESVRTLDRELAAERQLVESLMTQLSLANRARDTAMSAAEEAAAQRGKVQSSGTPPAGRLTPHAALVATSPMQDPLRHLEGGAYSGEALLDVIRLGSQMLVCTEERLVRCTLNARGTALAQDWHVSWRLLKGIELQRDKSRVLLQLFRPNEVPKGVTGGSVVEPSSGPTTRPIDCVHEAVARLVYNSVQSMRTLLSERSAMLQLAESMAAPLDVLHAE